jgi:uncharacterized repeat protein (TIGR02543 family)
VSDPGYHFVKWSAEATANPRIDTDVTGDISVTAVFAINTYTVSIQIANAGGSADADPPTVEYGGSSTVTISPDSGCYLAAITDNGDDMLGLVTGNTYTISSIDADHSIVVTFAADSYAITIDSSITGGTVTTDKASAAPGEIISINTSPDSGKWLVPGSLTASYGTDQTAPLTEAGDNVYTFTMPASAVSITAVFENIPATFCTVTFISDGITYTTKSVPGGSSIEAPEPPAKADYAFNGWYFDEALTTPVAFPYTVTEDITFFAGWTSLYPITIATVSGGSATVKTDAPNNKAAPGATVSVTITLPVYTGGDSKSYSGLNHQFKSIMVTGTDGTVITTTEVIPGEIYSFTMPSEGVRIAVAVEIAPLEVYLQEGEAGTPVLIHTYTQEEMETLPQTTQYYSGIDAMPADVHGKGKGVTLNDLINDLQQYNPGVFFGPGASLKLTAVDSWRQTFTFNYLFG